MARSRNLKHGFFKDGGVVSCSFPARLLFQGLWCLADYKGRLKYNELEIKMEIFPADNVVIKELMAELEENNLIAIYPEHSESTTRVLPNKSSSSLVQVIGFSKHQNPHKNEREDKDKKPMPCLPSQEECERKFAEINKKQKPETPETLGVGNTPRVLPECSPSNTIVIGLNPEPCTRGIPNPESRLADPFEQAFSLITVENQKLEPNKPKTISPPALSGKPDMKLEAKAAIDYLNLKIGAKYRHADSNLNFLIARFKEGHTLKDVTDVIDAKAKEWPPGDPQFKYLRPATLFNAEKFNQYIGQVGMDVSGVGVDPVMAQREAEQRQRRIDLGIDPDPREKTVSGEVLNELTPLEYSQLSEH